MSVWGAAIEIGGSAALLACVLGGCSDLDEYRTDSGEVFRGVVIGTDDDPGAVHPSSFIRRGFAAGTVLELSFDPDNAARVDPAPGVLTTIGPTGERALDATRLEPIAPLTHDQLSNYDFPGGGRVRNFVFWARPLAGPLAGRDATVFLSLMEDGSIEARIMARTIDGCDGPCEWFGVWPLTMQRAM